jgi:predicted lipid carrier protein YhbT
MNVSRITDSALLYFRRALSKEAASNLGLKDTDTTDTLLIEVPKELEKQNLRAKYAPQTEASKCW